MNAQGAAVTTLSAYKLWVDDVNKKGGLMIKEFNKRIPIEVTEYDDTSNAETAVRLTERLMTQDKVDFVLPPWSTGFNLAAAPVYARNGYPQLAVTANSNDAANLVKQMPTCSSSSTSRATSAARWSRCWASSRGRTRSTTRS